MKTVSILIFFFLIITAPAAAQKHIFIPQYSVSFPLSETHDFISKTSFRGFTFDYKYLFAPGVSCGVSTGWYAFYQETASDTYTTSDGASFSGKQFRYLNSVPILLTISYFDNPDSKLSPFAGLAFGATYNRQDVAMGTYSTQADPWHFTLAPEMGLMMHVEPGLGVYLSARYNTNFETETLSAQSYVGLNAGVFFY
jgi:hypothetical protein